MNRRRRILVIAALAAAAAGAAAWLLLRPASIPLARVRFAVVAGEKPPGVGLGLSIVKRILQYYGGRVYVSSVEGKGSTFGFALPRVQGEGQNGG